MIVDDDADVVAAADAARVGRDEQRRPDLHRHRAGLRDQRRLRPVRRRGDRAGAQAAPRFGRRGDLRADDHGVAGRRRPRGTSRTPRPRGGRVVRGGRRPSCPDENYVAPTVLLDVPEDAAAIREETFGPTLTITKVRDAEEALERANATSLRPGRRRCSPKSKARGLDLARRMRSGMTSVNSVHRPSPSVPALPFGGVGDSGFGRIHGEDGLRGVHPRQGDHPPAVRPAGQPDELRPAGVRRPTPSPASWA